MKIAWESLESHLDLAHGHSTKMTKKEIDEERQFHKLCVQNYAKLINLLSLLY